MTDSTTHQLPRARPGLALLAALVAAVLPACAPAAEDAPEAPPAGAGLVVVDPQFPHAPDELNLGNVLMGEVVERRVKLRNTSGAPITVRSVRPGCSCTTPRLSYADPVSGELVRGSTLGSGDVLSIPAGVTADLDLRVDTSIAPAKNKPKNVIVRITTDSLETPYLTLNVFMFVESYFRPNPAVLDLKEVAENGGGEGVLVLSLDNEDGRRLERVLRSPFELVPTLEEQHVGGTSLWTLKVKLLPPIPPGRHEYELLLATTGSGGEGEGEPFPVTVRALALPDAGIEPPMLLLTEQESGTRELGRARAITRLPGHSLRVLRAYVEGDGADSLRVDLVAERPDDSGRAASWGLSIVATEELEQRELSGTLVVETDDPQHARLEARWRYRPTRRE